MITFAHLVSIYRKSQCTEGKAIYCIDTEDELRLILALDEEYEKTGLVLLSDNPKVGDTVELRIEHPNPAFGRLYNDFNAFLLGDMAQIFDDVVGYSDYYIKETKISSTDNPLSYELSNYRTVKGFIHRLIAMDAYTNKSNKQLIFFSKNIFELSIDVSKRVTEFGDFISHLTAEHLSIIVAFTDWLDKDKDITKSHHDEKKSILAFVLTETFDHNAHLIDVLKKITEIYKSVEAQYALYIANFSYKKLLEQLNETNERFVARINDTINKILPQFLGLPFLTAIPTALESGDNWLVYTALLFYCMMCFLGLSTQKAVLDYIKADIKDYTDTTLPNQLAEQWQQNKQRINTLISKQDNLYWVLLISVVLCFFYGLYKLAIIFLCR